MKFSVTSTELFWAISLRALCCQANLFKFMNSSWERIPRDAANSVYSALSLMSAFTSRCDPTLFSLENDSSGKEETSEHLLKQIQLAEPIDLLEP